MVLGDCAVGGEGGCWCTSCINWNNTTQAAQQELTVKQLWYLPARGHMFHFILHGISYLLHTKMLSSHFILHSLCDFDSAICAILPNRRYQGAIFARQICYCTTCCSDLWIGGGQNCTSLWKRTLLKLTSNNEITMQDNCQFQVFIYK